MQLVINTPGTFLTQKDECFPLRQQEHTLCVFNEALTHITEGGRPYVLRQYLSQITERATDLASLFGFRQWGWVGGLRHDLGKYAPAFQNNLRAAAGDESRREVKERDLFSESEATHGLY